METSLSLLEQLRKSPDEIAWQRLVTLYTPLLEAWLRRFGVQKSDGDDLIQETLVAVFKALPDFEHNRKTGAFRRWLKLLLVHRCCRSFETANTSLCKLLRTAFFNS